MSRLLLAGVSVFWLGLSVLSDPVSSLLLPVRLATITPGEQVATTLGLATFFGLVAGMLVQPPTAQLSDALRARFGRRPFLIVGAVAALGGLALVGAGSAVPIVVLGYVLTQLAVNVAQAAQQGFIPDVVPERARGRAAALKAFLDLGGLVAGAVLVGALIGSGTAPVIVGLGAVVLGTLAGTLVLAREPTDPRAAVTWPRAGVRQTLGIDLTRHAAFVRIVAARFAFLLGTFAVGRFLFLYVRDRLALAGAEAARETAGLLVVLGIVAAVAALPAGWAAERVGRGRLMVAASLTSAIGVLFLIVAGTTEQIAAAGLLLSIGSGIFATANWARTADLVPEAEGARFFAIANYGTVAATAAAGLAGPLVDAGNATAQGSGYTLLFVVAAMCFGASAILAATSDGTERAA